jgi:hypothetical protein
MLSSYASFEQAERLTKELVLHAQVDSVKDCCINAAMLARRAESLPRNFVVSSNVQYVLSWIYCRLT